MKVQLTEEVPFETRDTEREVSVEQAVEVAAAILTNEIERNKVQYNKLMDEGRITDSRWPQQNAVQNAKILTTLYAIHAAYQAEASSTKDLLDRLESCSNIAQVRNLVEEVRNEHGF